MGKNNFLKAEPLQGFQGLEENIDPLTMSLSTFTAQNGKFQLCNNPLIPKQQVAVLQHAGGVLGAQSIQTVNRHAPF